MVLAVPIVREMLEAGYVLRLSIEMRRMGGEEEPRSDTLKNT
jgi:hypothetical protein